MCRPHTVLLRTCRCVVLSFCNDCTVSGLKSATTAFTRFTPCQIRCCFNLTVKVSELIDPVVTADRKVRDLIPGARWQDMLCSLHTDFELATTKFSTVTGRGPN